MGTKGGDALGRARKERKSVSEQNTEQQITVRQVTDVQASWTEYTRGEEGSFTLQLILDDGAEEYILQPTAEDLKVMMEMFKRVRAVYFDLGNKVLIPGELILG